MKLLITETEFMSKKSNDKIPLECEFCGKTFYNLKKHIIYWRTKNDNYFKFCSTLCENKTKGLLFDKKCTNCGKDIIVKKSGINKSGNQFCSSSCSATYNNTHKTTGYRRSKLEKYLEDILKLKYHNLNILFNDKSAINSELDIYIPSLNLAFELNGIFHYEPIFGEKTFSKIKANDTNKFNLCQKNNISLCIIDVSSQKYVTIKSSQIYLDIVVNIIDKNIRNN